MPRPHLVVRLAAIAALCLFVLAPQLSAQSWYSSSWRYRKTITIDRTKVQGTASLANFPVLISLTADSDLAARAQASGNDILFTASDGVTKLSHEIERYVSGQLVAWVKAPAVSPSVNTVLYLYYGNASAPSQQNSASVWDTNYKAVWHLADTSGTTVRDSTSNAANGTKSSASAPSAITGLLGGGQGFNGTSASVTFPGVLNLPAGMVSAWISPAVLAGTNERRMAGGFVEQNAGEPVEDEDKLLFLSRTAFKGQIWDGTNQIVASSTAPVVGTWYHVALVFDGASLRLFVNGNNESTRASGPSYSFSDPAFRLAPLSASIGDGENSRTRFSGRIDEVRVSLARSAEWIKTEYNNQNSPATFYSLGAQTTNTEPVPDTTLPSVSITAPANGATVQGVVTVSANASDNIGVAGVQFRLNGAALGAEDTVAPYSIAWTTSTNGQYTLTAVARDAAGNSATSTGITVTVNNVTADVTPPVISAIGATGVVATGATINWTTNEASDSQVEYGTTVGYGASTVLAPSMITSHSVALSGLTANTTYHYRVKSRDAAGNLATSADNVFTTPTQASGNWYNSAWLYRKRIVLDRTRVAGSTPLAGFPALLVRTSDADLAARALASGNDILFTADDGITKLPHENERYTAAAGELVAWVKVPSLSPAADTIVYMYYGNPAAAAQHNRPAVWDAGYRAVWHLSETSGSTIADSTSNAAHGTKSSASTPAAIAGLAGGAQTFNGTSAFVNFPGVPNLPIGMVSAWISPAVLPGASERRMAAGYVEQNAPEPVEDEDKLLFLAQTAFKGQIWDGTNQIAVGATAPVVGAWYHLALVFDGATLRLFVNGNNEATRTAAPSYSFSDPAFRLAPLSAAIGDGENSRTRFSGRIDEARVSAVRSADWIRTEYNNQSSPATFATFGPQSTSSSSGDTQPPTVSITQPAPGSVSGVLTLAADALDNVGVTGVEFAVDGNVVGDDTVAPYSVSWNSATTANGAHSLTARARDSAGNFGFSSPVSITVFNADTTAPLISSVSSTNITSTSATISWNTNEPADRQVEYGTSTAYGFSSPLESTLSTAHTVGLSGLAAQVTYHYRVRSRDAAGNLATSGDAAFTTPPVSTVTYAVMPFGDSITRGDGAHNTYRRPLWFKLQNAGYRVNFVGDYSDNSGLPPPNPDFDLDNQAVSGIRADQWLPFTDVAARHRAQRVLLYLGYNDLYNSQTAESTYTDIGQLIDALRGAVPSVVVFVAKPYLPTDPTLSSRVQTFNNGLPAFIASKTTAQSPVIMVDHTNVNAATETYDGLHPNDVGDAKLADNWFAALAPYLQ